MNITLYALSTCGWCRRTKAFLQDHKVNYQLFEVDLLQGEEKEEARRQVARFNPRMSFPTLVINDGEKVVVGYDEERLREVLGL